MRIRRTSKTITLAVDPFEAQALAEVLEELVRAYRIPPADLDAQTASVWYSTRGCQSAKMSAEDTAEWLQALHELKRANLARIEGWAAALNTGRPGDKTDRELRLGLDEAPALITALNDRRLMLAARHDIGEKELNLDLGGILTRLSPERRKAVIEIDLLAWLVESLVRALETQPPAE